MYPIDDNMNLLKKWKDVGNDYFEDEEVSIDLVGVVLNENNACSSVVWRRFEDFRTKFSFTDFY